MTKVFFIARNHILEHLSNKGAHLKGFNVYIHSEQSCTLIRAIYILNALEGHLNTPQKHQLLFKQLTQKTLQTTQEQNVIIGVFFDCLHKGTFHSSTTYDEFEALTSYKLRADLDEMVSKNS
tara:strand:+ start:452 stop:817 length:366 start_codon:yes stop_codon:yes gene_type:complete